MSMKADKRPRWVLSIVNEASCGWKETAFVAGGFGIDGTQPPARGECLEKFVSRVRVCHNLNCLFQGPGSVQVMKGWQIAANYIPSREFFIIFFNQRDDVNFPLEVLGDDGSQETEGVHNINWGVTQDDGRRWGWVLPEVFHHLHCFHSVELKVVLTAPGHQMVNLPPVDKLIHLRDGPNESGVIHKLQQFDGLVTAGCRWEKSSGERTQPWVWSGSQRHVFPRLMCCLLSGRKSMINLQVESDTLSCESLSCNRAGMIVLKAELKSTNRVPVLEDEVGTMLTASTTDLLAL